MGRGFGGHRGIYLSCLGRYLAFGEYSNWGTEKVGVYKPEKASVLCDTVSFR